MAPLQVGLAVQLHHYFGSKFLIDTLYSHGFCSSYAEVLKFESCAAAQVPLTMDIENDAVRSLMSGNGHFRQFVCDNADRNPWSLDGKKALHAMGIIETVTPAIRQRTLIRRDNQSNIQSQSVIPIHYYDRPKSNKPIIYARLRQVRREIPVSLVDVLWKVCWPLKPDRPGWSGFMQVVEKEEHKGKATVRFLPMLDMDLTDMSCIYSTLQFLTSECARHKCTPIVTFDSPLYWKARIIISNEADGSSLKRIVLDLGGFHTMLSFLGSIGHVMHNSGLSEILKVVYGENAGKAISKGKSYARAIRAHLMTTLALHALLLQETYGIPLTSGERDEGYRAPPDLQNAVEFFNHVRDGESLTACQEVVLRRIWDNLKETEKRLEKNPTAALFLEYVGMVDLLRDFVRAQRTGDWS